MNDLPYGARVTSARHRAPEATRFYLNDGDPALAERVVAGRARSAEAVGAEDAALPDRPRGGG